MASGITVKGRAEYMLAMRKVRRAMIDDNMLRKIAETAIKLIKKRTQSGIDANLKPAKPKKDGTIRTLKKSGRLFRAITSRISGSTITICIDGSNNSQIIAEVHNYGMRSGRGAGFKMPKYYWFDLSKTDLQKLRKLQEREFESLIKSALR